MGYAVYVDDNFHYQDEGERYKLGDFAAAGEALAAARKIVDDFLRQAFRPGMTARELYSAYQGFGEDPFIVSDDPACVFSAWDYARERCAELTGTPLAPGTEEPAMGQNSADISLREELEEVYRAQVRALEEKDPEAFLATVYGARGGTEAFRGRFGEAAESLLEMMPRLEKSDFVAIRTGGDDLAGYYLLRRDPPFASVCLVRFVKVEGRWRITPDSFACSFEPKEGEDAVGRARKLVETEAGLRLERPAPEEEPPTAPPSSWNEAVQATIDVMAYGYEVRIAINGATIPFAGGKSYSGRLFGFAEGGEPVPPAVLMAGENQIGVDYRRTGDLGSTLEIAVRGPSGDPVLQFGPVSGESGRLGAAFRLPGP